MPWRVNQIDWMERQQARQRQMHIAFHECCYPWSPKTKLCPLLVGNPKNMDCPRGYVPCLGWSFAQVPTCDHQIPVKLTESAWKTLEDCSIQKICPSFLIASGLVGGWTNPFLKNICQIESFPQVYMGEDKEIYMSCHHPAAFQWPENSAGALKAVHSGWSFWWSHGNLRVPNATQPRGNKALLMAWKTTLIKGLLTTIIP